MSVVVLDQEQERVAAEIIAAGRYSTMSEVISAAFHELRQIEAQRAALVASVYEAEAEGERNGFLTSDEVASKVNATIARRSARPA